MKTISDITQTYWIKDLPLEVLQDIQLRLESLGYQINTMGIFDKETIVAFDDFKQKNYLANLGQIGVTTRDKLLEKTSARDFVFLPSPKEVNGRKLIVDIPAFAKQERISKSDLEKLAIENDMDKAMLRAFLNVETNGDGMLYHEDKPFRPKILFEGHWFYKLTPKPVSKTRPDLSHKTWNKENNKGGSREWNRLTDAIEFDIDNALKSASWGLGQVMGFNYKQLGYKSVRDFVVDAHKSEAHQVQHMLDFCKVQAGGKLWKAIKSLDFNKIAYYYNGPRYAKNNYHVKLENEYKSLKA